MLEDLVTNLNYYEHVEEEQLASSVDEPVRAVISKKAPYDAVPSEEKVHCEQD